MYDKNAKRTLANKNNPEKAKRRQKLTKTNCQCRFSIKLVEVEDKNTLTLGVASRSNSSFKVLQTSLVSLGSAFCAGSFNSSIDNVDIASFLLF